MVLQMVLLKINWTNWYSMELPNGLSSKPYDFTIETFEIKLEQPGADEIVVLTHDNDDIDNYASIELDRNAATNGAHLHANNY